MTLVQKKDFVNPGDYFQPSDLAHDSAGNVWLASRWAYIKFTSDGKEVLKIERKNTIPAERLAANANPAYQADHVYGVTVDNEGNVYVVSGACVPLCFDIVFDI